MKHFTPTSLEVNLNSVLTASPKGENFQITPAANPGHTEGSQTPNNCSVPKSVDNNTENNVPENDTDEAYAERRQKCMHDIETLTGKALKLTYPKEYKTWSNSKNRSKKLKGITGPHWGTDLDAFPGFLKQVGPKRHADDSLDRIDPSYGYVPGNVRWASKQLQSENRKNVEVILVRGVPMTKPQLADLLGITYDALRMRLYRGDTVDSILVDHLNAEKPVAKLHADKIEACPWPEAKEWQWEEAFKAERESLLDHQDQGSRTAFFVAKCMQELGRINREGLAYANKHGPEEPMPASWVQKYEYWVRLKRFAVEQREKVLKEKFPPPPPYSLEPSEEELSMMEECLGAPLAIDDEDIGRSD